MLDPADWEAFRRDAHRVIDDAIDYLRNVRDRAVWRPVPDEIKSALQAPLPQEPAPLGEVYEEFRKTIMPYATGNIHPRFWGWVHGSGTPTGALADLLAACMNSNLGGRDHGAIYVERQVARWFLDLFGWPQDASGILLTGTSVANINAVVAARAAARASAAPLAGYASSATHAAVKKAFIAAGLGVAALRVVPVDRDHRIDPAALEEMLRDDRAAGMQPFLLVGNAGTVDVGAIDPLPKLAAIARREAMWFHVDGAFGAAAYLSHEIRPKLRGIESADSIAFDFHKWLHVPYDCGCLLVRDGAKLRAAFASEGPYITRMPNGLAAGEPWFADMGQELSRSFRALKVWFTIKEHGARRLGEAIAANCAQARYLRERLASSGAFEVHAAGELQIVCFRPNDAPDALVDDVVVQIQESGHTVISSTTIDGRRFMRACITNQRTTFEDVDAFVEVVTRMLGERQPSRRA